MSNAMSRSKSRWKGALLATVATAVVSPLAAKGSMAVGVYLNPFGSAGPYTTNYVTPDTNGTAIPLYVYAVVTGANPVTPTSGSGTLGTQTVSGGDFNGLQYLYYNLLATGGNTSGITGGITATTLNSTLGFDSTGTDAGSSNTSGGGGAQSGVVQLTAGSSLTAGSTVVAVGAPSAWNVSAPSTSPVALAAQTQFAKPRAGSPVWSNYASQNVSANTYTYLNDGTNIIIGTGSNGLATNQTAFLVEKFNYTPSAFNASTPGNLVSTSFSIQTPFNSGGGSLMSGTSYAPSNSFNDSSTSISTGGSLAALTNSNYSSGHTVTLTDTLLGDANGDGKVNSTDLNTVLQDFGQPFATWASGNFVGSGNINSTDLNDVLQFFGQNVGGAPADIAVDAAVLADPQAVSLLEAHGFTPVAASSVPEPGSLVLAGVGAVSLLGRGRKRRSS